MSVVRRARLAAAAAALVTTAVAAGPVVRAATGDPAPSGVRASAVTCAPAEGFSRTAGGLLYRVTDPTLLQTADTLTESGSIGKGWGDFAWTGAGGDGVLYALTKTGKLVWYRYDLATSSWTAGSGRVVAIGLTPTRNLVNIAVGANGWIYVVKPNGSLVLMQHTGRLTGAATWARSGGVVIGTGWSQNDVLAPQGDGVIYRQSGGSLYWFRHSDPATGAVTWTNGGRPVRIGTGWRFYDLLALGGGVLLTTAAPSGQVSLWQHADPAGGGQGWTVSNLSKYVARAESFGVSIAPGTCA